LQYAWFAHLRHSPSLSLFDRRRGSVFVVDVCDTAVQAGAGGFVASQCFQMSRCSLLEVSSLPNPNVFRHIRGFSPDCVGRCPWVHGEGSGHPGGGQEAGAVGSRGRPRGPTGCQPVWTLHTDFIDGGGGFAPLAFFCGQVCRLRTLPTGHFECELDAHQLRSKPHASTVAFGAHGLGTLAPHPSVYRAEEDKEDRPQRCARPHRMAVPPEGSQCRGDAGRPDGYSSCSLSFFFKPRATAFFGGLSAPHSSHASDNSGHTRPNIGGVAWVQSGSGAHGHDRWARPAPNLSPASAMGTDRGSGILAGSGARGRIWRTSPTAGATGPTPRGAAGPTPRGAAAPTAIAPRALPKAYVSP